MGCFQEALRAISIKLACPFATRVYSSSRRFLWKAFRKSTRSATPVKGLPCPGKIRSTSRSRTLSKLLKNSFKASSGSNPTHNAWRDALQYVIACNKHFQRGFVETNMPIVMTRGSNYLKTIRPIAVHIAIGKIKQIRLIFKWKQFCTYPIGVCIALFACFGHKFYLAAASAQ